MAGVHALLAWLTAGSTLAVLLAAAPAALGRATGRRWIDRAILIQVGCAVLVCVAGLAVAITQGGPGDWLHFVYGIVVLAVLPVTRYAAHDKSERRFARWLAVAALIAMGALLRSFMTGR